MTDTTPDAILARAQAPAVNGRPIRNAAELRASADPYIRTFLS